MDLTNQNQLWVQVKDIELWIEKHGCYCYITAIFGDFRVITMLKQRDTVTFMVTA